MFDLATNVLALIFVLGVMIFVHEFGHFATAKYFGVHVEVFALGFGPRLFGFHRGETDYRVCVLPLGGYVKMKGENPDEPLSGATDEFLSRPKYQRFFVLLAGPAMNVALAFVLLTVVFTRGLQVETYQREPADIGWVLADAPAASSGLARGDRVVAIDGKPISNWQELRLQVLISGGQELELTVENEAGTRSVLVTPDRQPRTDQGFLGVVAAFDPVIGTVLEDSPAAAEGLRDGDRFVMVAGETIVDWSQVVEIIRDRAEEPTEITVDRDGKRLAFTVTPRTLPVEYGGRGSIGVIRVLEIELRSYGFLGSMAQAATEIKRQTTLVGQILARLFTGRMSLRTLSGPIEIARYSGGAARTGDPFVLFFFMAIISLQLGLLNLLPIPVLDGGHITVLLFEGLIRRDLSLQVKEKMMTIGVVLLVTLMLVVITFDVIKSLPNGVGSLWPF